MLLSKIQLPHPWSFKSDGLFNFQLCLTDSHCKMFWTTSHCVKVSKYGVISGLYFHVVSPNTGKYGPEINPYLDTFHAVNTMKIVRTIFRSLFEDSTISTKFLKSHICNTFCIEIITLLGILTIKDWRILKSDKIMLYWKEWMLVNGMSFDV